MLSTKSELFRNYVLSWMFWGIFIDYQTNLEGGPIDKKYTPEKQHWPLHKNNINIHFGILLKCHLLQNNIRAEIKLSYYWYTFPSSFAISFR